MKEVKIYTIVSDQLSPPITGESFCTDMVRHSDYAELEDKYAALAADNDKAMESLKQADAVVKLAHEKFSALASENAALKKSEVEFNEYCRRECEDVGDTWVDDFTETPATDTFLAEVTQEAVESLKKEIEWLKKQLLMSVGDIRDLIDYNPENGVLTAKVNFSGRQ
ncbi:HNH endonuclease, partial [Salmonella enterica subsp. enterica serovar Hadar]